MRLWGPPAARKNNQHGRGLDANHTHPSHAPLGQAPPAAMPSPHSGNPGGLPLRSTHPTLQGQTLAGSQFIGQGEGYKTWAGGFPYLASVCLSAKWG